MAENFTQKTSKMTKFRSRTKIFKRTVRFMRKPHLFYPIAGVGAVVGVYSFYFPSMSQSFMDRNNGKHFHQIKLPAPEEEDEE